MMDRDDVLVGVGGDGGISNEGAILPNVGGYLPLIEQGKTTVGYCRYRQAILRGAGGILYSDSNSGIRRGFLPQGDRKYSPLSQPTAQQVIIDTVSAGPTTVFLLGSHTNFALFLMTNPQLKKNIKHIYIMGGGIRSKNPTGCCPKNAGSSCKPQQCGDRGNLFTSYASNPYAEYNIFVDPFAAYQNISSLMLYNSFLLIIAADFISTSAADCFLPLPLIASCRRLLLSARIAFLPLLASCRHHCLVADCFCSLIASYRHHCILPPLLIVSCHRLLLAATAVGCSLPLPLLTAAAVCLPLLTTAIPDHNHQTTFPNRLCLHSSRLSHWIVDSGATHHITLQKSPQFLASPYPKFITVANGDTAPVSGSTDMPLSPSISLRSVLHVSGSAFNLLSVSRLTDVLDCSVTFTYSYFVMQDRRT
ncbi:hypothetical protein KSP39_PZI003904 [Platanthera zijinensis]|uniref:Inosine/uridine-preferring nucleoside hydrolase domain-containing protein n=1 Tax=Platanthera zijinensis TaxID=2320716 RepID=A0AAP0BV68_9ASPA